MLYYNAGTLSSLGHLAKESNRPDFSIDGFPEYATTPDSLAPDQRRVLSAAAAAIERSQATFHPIVGAFVFGHSDKALRKPLHERAQFELEISNKRATAAADTLRRELVMQSHGAHYARCFRCLAVGMGNARPRHPHAANEQQMRQNRRVEIVLVSQVLGQPQCGTV